MTKVQLVPGNTYDLVSPGDLDQHYAKVSRRMEELWQAGVSGIKPIRFSSGVVLGATNPQVVSMTQGPRSGFVWTIVRLVGVTSGGVTTVQWFRTSDPSAVDGSAAGLPSSIGKLVDVSLSANLNVAKTYSAGQLLLDAGEVIAGSFSGASVVGSSLIVSGAAIEVPAEMVGKLLL